MANESTLPAPIQAIRRLAGRRAAAERPVAVVTFIAGFSERWVNVIFGRAQRVLGTVEAPKPKSNPPTDEGSPRV